MRSDLYTFTFTKAADLSEVEATFALAALAVGCLVGDPAVRLDAGYAVDEAARAVTVDVQTETGRSVARVFAGLCLHEFGDRCFSIARKSADATAGRQAPIMEAAA